MSFVSYPEEEKRKSALLLQVALLCAEGQEEAVASRFAEAADLEEVLARRADAEGNSLRAIRSHFSVASAWSNAGDLHHALTLEQRPDAPAPSLKRCASDFATGTIHSKKRICPERSPFIPASGLVPENDLRADRNGSARQKGQLVGLKENVIIGRLINVLVTRVWIMSLWARGDEAPN